MWMGSSLTEWSNPLIEKVETSIWLEVFWSTSLVAIIWGINTYDNHFSFCRSTTIVGPISWLNLMTFILFIKNYRKLFFIGLEVKMKLFTFWKLANMDISKWAFLFLWLSNMTQSYWNLNLMTILSDIALLGYSFNHILIHGSTLWIGILVIRSPRRCNSSTRKKAAILFCTVEN